MKSIGIWIEFCAKDQEYRVTSNFLQVSLWLLVRNIHFHTIVQPREISREKGHLISKFLECIIPSLSSFQANNFTFRFRVIDPNKKLYSQFVSKCSFIPFPSKMGVRRSSQTDRRNDRCLTWAGYFWVYPKLNFIYYPLVRVQSQSKYALVTEMSKRRFQHVRCTHKNKWIVNLASECFISSNRLGKLTRFVESWRNSVKDRSNSTFAHCVSCRSSYQLLEENHLFNISNDIS